jgi:predicted extracellular nuclease
MAFFLHFCSMVKYAPLFALFLFLQLNGLAQQKPGSLPMKALVYNVENLFDTINDPKKDDEEFLPTSKKNWNGKRYAEKLRHITQVIGAAGYPELVGLCEIENKLVLDELVAMDSLKPYGYQVVHYESPDERGIDVGLLIRSKGFKLVYSKSIRVDLPGENARPTRDILYAKMVFKRDTLHVFVNHWPSRRGGEEESEPNRIAAAKTLKQVTDSLFKIASDAKMLVMGDFNDYPTNKSLKDVLGASPVEALAKRTGFVNLVAPLMEKGQGSEMYQGKWTMLINVIGSTSLVKASKGLKVGQAEILKKDFLMFKNEKKGMDEPNRTYGGDRYYGGYSDHLPVSVDLQWNK